MAHKFWPDKFRSLLINCLSLSARGGGGDASLPGHNYIILFLWIQSMSLENSGKYYFHQRKEEVAKEKVKAEEIQFNG